MLQIYGFDKVANVGASQNIMRENVYWTSKRYKIFTKRREIEDVGALDLILWCGETRRRGLYIH